MAQQHSTTTTATPYHGRWILSLKQWTCEACGRPIFPGEHFLWFPWFPGRQHSVACRRCGEGDELPAPVSPALGEVAA